MTIKQLKQLNHTQIRVEFTALLTIIGWHMIAVIIFGSIAYAIGSLSSAIFVCKFLNLPDPRTSGSENPGATNVLRIGGKTPALITLGADMLKGFIPVLLAHMSGINGFFTGIVAVAAILGHIFPVFFNFKGGKGVATALGAFLALSPISGLAILITWVTIAATFRYSSLASLISAITAPIFMLLLGNAAYFLPCIIIAAILIWRHIANIQRLRAGTESKISF